MEFGRIGALIFFIFFLWGVVVVSKWRVWLRSVEGRGKHVVAEQRTGISDTPVLGRREIQRHCS